jgi:hypothetical protein
VAASGPKTSFEVVRYRDPSLYFVMAACRIVVIAYDWNLWVGSAIFQTTDDAYLQADINPPPRKVRTTFATLLFRTSR